MSFYEDLKFGQDAERRLLERHPFLEYTDGRTSDFRIKGTNIFIEKKADSYDFYKYENLIMERYSKEEKPGGPFSAVKTCRYFIYNFVANDIVYVFKTVQLVARIKKLVKKHDLKLHDRWNPGYVTRYYKIPFKYLEDIVMGMDSLETEYDKAVKRKKARKAVKP